MSSKNVAVFGIYSTRPSVENATESLVRAGFPITDISVLLPEGLAAGETLALKKDESEAG
jgi:hypothetical protein